MEIKTIEWKNNAIRLIDQTLLPCTLRYLTIKDLKTLWMAIKELKVRGAPAIGAAGALGVYLGVKDSKAKSFDQFLKEVEKVSAYLASSRPTARNLFWALERMERSVRDNSDLPILGVKTALFAEALAIMDEDRKSCRRIGEYGQTLIKSGDRVLTVCNAGILATIDYGTALGVLYAAHDKGKRIKVYACETRPLLQGARLTTWELSSRGIDVTLICDNMAATLMKQGRIDKVIAGADRIAANGDAANKIGTYNLAVLAKFHKIPFYIAAPSSTFDRSIKSGADIPIEQRKAEEVTTLYYAKPMAAKGVKVYNPAFDVTDASLITAIISDRGIIKPPFKAGIARVIPVK
ncbi:MAG: S-methyl-5-thioribose-1-phosphate isomerase [Deltaproteobacteria bacterium]